MRKATSLALTLIFISRFSTLEGQIYDPVKWSFDAKVVSYNEADILFKAAIEPGWHLYGHYIPDNGPVPTSFTLEPSDDYELSGKLMEATKGEEKFDESFGMTLKLFSHNALFKQRIKVKSTKDFVLQGFVEFMCCDNEKCLPPREVEFKLNIQGASPKVAEIQKETEPVAEVSAAKKGDDTPAGMDTIIPSEINDTPIETNEESPLGGDDEMGNKSLLSFFLLAFIAGLAGIFTPCVFPMIPMTVSFFMRGSPGKTRGIFRGLVFGLSIILIYTLIGLIISLTSAGADFTNIVSAHWIPNTIFFLLFLVFAASFLGMFELVLPGSLANKVDAKAEKGGMSGAFFMALALVIVSFSCTGPIIGALLVEAAGEEVLKPTLGMFGFSLAFALPFTLFAIFPSWLKGLPKSGGWLNAVKVVLGFIILAFSLKFLSALDQHQKFLTRELYLALWMVIFLLLGFYLLGKIKLAHDSELKHVGVIRLMLSILSFTFAVYIFPGLFGAPLTAISPLIPPKTNHSFDLVTLIQANRGINIQTSKSSLCNIPKYADILHLPYGLEGYFDYEEGLRCAEEQNKPLFIDFKGHQCSNCKLMEAKVWSDPEVLKRLRNDFIIVALYTDDNTKLPEDEWITSSYDGKVKKTMGKKNLDFEISRFNSNAQPLYVILDHEGKKLTRKLFSVNLKVQHFIDFLEEGKRNFTK